MRNKRTSIATSFSWVRLSLASPRSMLAASTLTSDMSFTMTAHRSPWRFVRMWCSSVVLPEPKKPDKIVTGSRTSSCAAPGSSFATAGVVVAAAAAAMVFLRYAHTAQAMRSPPHSQCVHHRTPRQPTTQPRCVIYASPMTSAAGGVGDFRGFGGECRPEITPTSLLTLEQLWQFVVITTACQSRPKQLRRA